MLTERPGRSSTSSESASTSVNSGDVSVTMRRYDPLIVASARLRGSRRSRVRGRRHSVPASARPAGGAPARQARRHLDVVLKAAFPQLAPGDLARGVLADKALPVGFGHGSSYHAAAPAA